MEDITLNHIREEAIRFRCALEHIKEDSIVRILPNNFRSFPQGCCGDSSELFCYYLREEKGIITKYIRSSNASHAWLEYKDYIIDLTADQFKNISEKIIITKDRTWYEQYYPIKDREIDCLETEELSILYTAVRKIL